MDEDRIHPLDELWEVVAHTGFDPALVAEFEETVRRRPWKSLGRVLIERGRLSVPQARVLAGLQVDEPTLRLGDLAVREGFCTVDEVREALEHQRAEHPGPIELMAEDPRIDPRQLLVTLAAYVRHLEGRVVALRQRLAASGNGPG